MDAVLIITLLVLLLSLLASANGARELSQPSLVVMTAPAKTDSGSTVIGVLTLVVVVYLLITISS